MEVHGKEVHGKHLTEKDSIKPLKIFYEGDKEKRYAYQ